MMLAKLSATATSRQIADRTRMTAARPLMSFTGSPAYPCRLPRLSSTPLVMPALVAGIHVLRRLRKKNVDGRDKPGHDEVGRARQISLAFAETLVVALGG